MAEVFACLHREGEEWVRYGGITTTIIDGGGIDSIFHISPSVVVTISDVTLRNGKATDGGGILNEGGILTLNNVALNGNHEDAKYTLHLVRGRRFYKQGSVSDIWDAITEFGYASVLRPEAVEPVFYMAQAYEKKDNDACPCTVEKVKNQT